jgi:NADPH2:quinone reductase
MKAIVIEGNGGPKAALVFQDVPAPTPSAQDLLVAVRCAAVNRADLRRAASHFAASDQKRQAAIAGVEMAGEVTGMGAEVRGFAIGDRVMAMTGGAYAEQVCIDHRLALPVPDGFSWQEAAATPISFITAHDALVTAGQLQQSQTVLVQGGSTGAGIATVQIARLLGVGKIFATAGRPDKLAKIRALGCDVALNYREDDVVAEVRRNTSGIGVDLVIDIVGGSAAQVNIDALAIRGRIVCLGRVAGLEATINLDEFSRKRACMIGVTFRTRSLDERIEAVRRFSRDLLAALADRRIRPIVDSEFPLEEAARAQEHVRANHHFGKVLLRV